MAASMQFIVSFKLYIDIGTKNLFSISSQSEQNQSREQMKLITAELFIYLSVDLYLIIKRNLFV